jgi:hypothetical protein
MYEKHTTYLIPFEGKWKAFTLNLGPKIEFLLSIFPWFIVIEVVTQRRRYKLDINSQVRNKSSIINGY